MINTLTILKWCVPLAFGFHIVEELFWPGGFNVWYHEFRKHLKGVPLSYYYKVNAIYFLGTLMVPLSLHPTFSNYLMLWVIAVLVSNLVFTHIRGAITTKTYSPGIVTGTLLYIPLAIYSYWYLLSNQIVDLFSAVMCLIWGPLLEIWFAFKRPTITDH